MRSMILVILAITFSVALAGTTYIVKIGDTLEGIAAANGVSVETLAQGNNIDPPYIIWTGEELIIPAPVPAMVIAGTDSTTVIAQVAHPSIWTRRPECQLTAGRFENQSVDGYYRSARFTWRLIDTSPDLSIGPLAEFGDDFCQSDSTDWSESGHSARAGIMMDYYHPGSQKWFPCWNLKTYYGFRHAEGRNGSWDKIQEDNTWTANLWVGVWQDITPWFSQTNLFGEYSGLISSKAVGGDNGHFGDLIAYSPVKWEGCLEERVLFYKERLSVFGKVGYRHLDGQSLRCQDRVLFGASIQLGWLKANYELERENNKNTNKLEAQVSF